MDELLQTILDIPTETQTIEFKRLTWDKVVSKIIETIVAIANTDWWWIVIGVDDPDKTELKWLGRVYWIEEDMDLYDSIWREIQRIVPPISNIWEPTMIKENKIK